MTEARTCPVCGKAITPELEKKWNQDGSWIYFDDMGCRNRFIGNPEKYGAGAGAG